MPTPTAPGAPAGPPDPTDLELLREAAVRLVRTVDAFSDDDWTAPSRLPCWSRAHVVAHLLRNAEGLAASLHGVVAGEQVPMYPSQERRDGDIEELAAAGDRAELRDRLLGSTTELTDALAWWLTGRGTGAGLTSDDGELPGIEAW